MYMMHQPKEVADMVHIDWVAFLLIPVIIYQGYKQFADGLA
jgi:MATE family multidrug resistance protein